MHGFDSFPCSDPSPLGSGKFGDVIKATWKSPSGNLEVAAKKLHEGALLEERIKFLREAAIMRQFNHPNVVQIKGVMIGCLAQSKDTVSAFAYGLHRLFPLSSLSIFCSSHSLISLVRHDIH